MRFEKIDNLLLMERIAAGGMAEVFRSKQFGTSGFEKTVAVKRILPSFASSTEFKSMFQAEANLSAMLEHPNIVHTYSNGIHEDYLYLVMEFVEGKNLSDIINKNSTLGQQIPLSLCCYIVSEAAKGLDYAHNFHNEENGEALNIVHRDVNHHNILLSFQGNVKIVDFGVAKVAATSNVTQAGVLKGKIAYMSPEQAMGKPVDQRSDIFSLGVVLWELLTRQSLFIKKDEVSTLEHVRNCVVPSPKEHRPDLDSVLEKIVIKALEKDPTARYQSAKEFLADVQKYINANFPDYTTTDVSSYLTELFANEIATDKLRRSKLNEEAKAYLQQAAPKAATARKVSAFGGPDTIGVKKRSPDDPIPSAVTTNQERPRIQRELAVNIPTFAKLSVTTKAGRIAKLAHLNNPPPAKAPSKGILTGNLFLFGIFAIGIAAIIYFVISH